LENKSKERVNHPHEPKHRSAAEKARSFGRLISDKEMQCLRDFPAGYSSSELRL
jgi:hypothetical protein